MESRIINDKRKIEALYFNDIEDKFYMSGPDFEITAYGEPREFCEVAFYEVKDRGKVITRIPATMVQVVYADE